MQNYKMVLCYDGSRYRGWQRQGNTGATVQGKLEDTLSRLLGQSVEVNGAGRTDAGVHARQQTASFRAETGLPCDELLSALRAHLPEDIGVISLTPAPPRFHARLSCTGKTYVYRIWNSDSPCVFERKYVWKVPEMLDEAAMRRAAAFLLGEHDFSAFRTGHGKKSAVRRLEEIAIERHGDELHISLSGNGFLYNMARIITGTLVEVGRVSIDPEDIPRILASLDRTQAGPTAPAQGLCLYETRYE